LGGGGRRIKSLKPAQATFVRLLSQKQNTNKNKTHRGGGKGITAQVVMCLLRMYEALGSIPSTTKKKKKSISSKTVLQIEHI
jgi:hypothetical protein